MRRGVESYEVPDEPMQRLLQADPVLSAFAESLRNPEAFEPSDVENLPANLEYLESFVGGSIREVEEGIEQLARDCRVVEETIQASPELSRWKAADRSLIESAVARVERHDADENRGLRAYGGAGLARKAKRGEFSPGQSPLFMDWIWMEWRPSRNAPTIAEQMAREAGLTREQRAILTSRARSAAKPYQLTRAVPKEGVEMEDLVDGGRVFVDDVALSMNGRPWMILLARTYAAGPFTFMVAETIAFPPAYKRIVKDWVERNPKSPDGSLAVGELLEILLEQMKKPPVRQLVNTEGHKLAPSSAQGDVTDFAAALAWLRDQPDFRETSGPEAPPHEFTWLGDDGPAGRVVSGHLTLSADRCVLECESRQRINRGVRLLKKAPGVVVRTIAKHTAGSVRDRLKELWQARSLVARGPQASAPDELARLTGQWKRKYYEEDWLVSPIPMLGGKTPRQAAADASARPLLLDLLREFEYQEGNDPDPAQRYDVDRLRSILGLREK